MKQRYTFWHHGFFLSIIRFLLGPIFRFYYRFSGKRILIKQSGPYLILANHTAEFDIIFLGLVFDAPLYFVASDQLLNSGKGSWFLKTFFNPIPKSKSVADLAVVKRIKSVIDEGGNVAIFPEGNASINGGPSKIPDGIGRLIKFLQVPVKLIKIDGLYLSSPRWSYYRKFGPSTMTEIKTLTVEECSNLTPEAIDSIVTSSLAISAYDQPLGRYEGKHKSAGLHKLIFTCPKCRGLLTTYSHRDRLACSTCDFNGHYTNEGQLMVDGNQKDLIQCDRENLTRFDQEMARCYQTFSHTFPADVSSWDGTSKRRSPFVKSKVIMNHLGMTIITKVTSQFIPYSEIFSEAIQVRTKLLIYPQVGPMLLFRLPKVFSPYAVLNIIKWYKHHLKEGALLHEPTTHNPHSFLGL